MTKPWPGCSAGCGVPGSTRLWQLQAALRGTRCASARRSSPGRTRVTAPPETPSRRRRVAVLGGTFDPIHVGHLAIAEQARERLGADEAWLVPTGRPPHRQSVAASAADRLDMVCAAVAGPSRPPGLDPGVPRPGPPYTADTRSPPQARHPRVQLLV